MSIYKVEFRDETLQSRASYTGNGGYTSSPDDGCTSIHLTDPNSAVDEAMPFTIIKAYEELMANEI